MNRKKTGVGPAPKSTKPDSNLPANEPLPPEVKTSRWREFLIRPPKWAYVVLIVSTFGVFVGYSESERRTKEKASDKKHVSVTDTKAEPDKIADEAKLHTLWNLFPEITRETDALKSRLSDLQIKTDAETDSRDKDRIDTTKSLFALEKKLEDLEKVSAIGSRISEQNRILAEKIAQLEAKLVEREKGHSVQMQEVAMASPSPALKLVEAVPPKPAALEEVYTDAKGDWLIERVEPGKTSREYSAQKVARKEVAWSENDARMIVKIFPKGSGEPKIVRLPLETVDLIGASYVTFHPQKESVKIERLKEKSS